MPGSDTDMADADLSNGANGNAKKPTSISQIPDVMDDGYKHSQRIRILPGSSDTAASFQFLNEDHTLGNALRHLIMKNPAVEFCGYSIPHPADPKMNLRIQTYDDVNVMDVLEKGLDDLAGACDVVLGKFRQARDELPRQTER